MIKQPTTFVIGAGASKELGLPLGGELRSQIGKHLTPEPGDGDFSSDDTLDYALRMAVGGHATVEPGQVKSACRMLAAAMPYVSSIDNYINNHSGNPELEFCGKLAIARIILAYEHSSALYRPNRIGSIADPQKLAASYLPTLFNILQEGVHRSDVTRIFDNVSFVVFNYDRCLEQFLQYALEQAYGLRSDEAANVVDRARIVHPYGVVGRLPWQSASGYKQPFGADDDPSALIECAKEIMTFGERIAEERITKQLGNITTYASRIVFLGMAYHPQNLELLRSVADNPWVHVFGTAVGLSEFDREIVVPALKDAFQRVSAGCNVKLLPRSNCSQALGELARLLAT